MENPNLRPDSLPEPVGSPAIAVCLAFGVRDLVFTALAVQLLRKGRQCGRADVVLDALRVDFGGFFRDAKGTEKGDYDTVAVLAFGGECAAGFRQENRPVGLDAHVTLALKAGEGAVDRDVGHAEPAGQVHHTGFALGGGEIGDGLDVVLRRLGGVLAARLLQAFGLQSGGADGFPDGFLHERDKDMEKET